MEKENEQLALFPDQTESEAGESELADGGSANKNRTNELDGKTWTRYSISIWSDLRKTSEEIQLKHPAMFPLALPSRAIACFTSKEDVTVLDPFAGVGTTILAARDAGKNGVGIEISPEFSAIATNRLSQSPLLGTETGGKGLIHTDDALLSVTQGQNSFRSFQVPPVFLDENTPDDLKREFVKGFADVAGNVRYANRYVDGRHRVRLDVLNHSLNWAVPVQLCLLLQEGLQIPVQNITWGHPNMNRDFREHQINIFAVPFLKIGFTFQHKPVVLEELALQDTQRNDSRFVGCPGRRRIRVLKDSDDRENDDRLPPEIRGKHFDSYWQICKAFGCTREPQPAQLSLFEPLESEE